jgi:hypothetical protein
MAGNMQVFYLPVVSLLENADPREWCTYECGRQPSKAACVEARISDPLTLGTVVDVNDDDNLRAVSGGALLLLPLIGSLP